MTAPHTATEGEGPAPEKPNQTLSTSQLQSLSAISLGVGSLKFCVRKCLRGFGLTRRPALCIPNSKYTSVETLPSVLRRAGPFVNLANLAVQIAAKNV